MIQLRFDIEGGNFTRAGFASSEVKKVLKQLNVAQPLIKKIVVALYEAEVNIVAHAYRGTIEVLIAPEKVVVELKDEGPGIPDIDKAMEEGFSTASQKVREMGFGAGMGLPNIKRNSDEFSIESEIGKGTNLQIVKYLSDAE